MKTLRILFVLSLLALLNSCGREIDAPEEHVYKTIHYCATAQGGIVTRAGLDNDHYIFEAGDRLFVSHEEENETVLYGFLTLISGAGESIAYFEGDLACDEDFKVLPGTSIKVTLVSSNDQVHTVAKGKITNTSYTNGQFAANLEEAVRKFSDFTCTTTYDATTFVLEQKSTFLVSRVKLQSSEAPSNTEITAILYNNSNESLRTIKVNTVPVGTGASQIDFVLAFPGDEVTLSSAKLALSWTDHQQEFSNINGGLLAANNYYTISRSCFSFAGFRIRAKEEGTKVYFKYTDGSVLYSKDYGETWSIPPTQANGGIDLDANEEACFQANPENPTRTNCNLAGNNQLFTTNGKLCYIAGNITSLLADPNTLETNAFRGAFSRKNTTDGGNTGSDSEKPTAITVSPSTPSDYVDWIDIDPLDPLILPATTAANCYMDMFLGCISLTSAPDLPATELADKCYFRMFHSCFGLTSMPSFPSVVTMSGSSTRRRYCYQMFQSCTGITELTEPLFVGVNSTLQRGCFEDMFAHCTSLTSVIPGLLPATTLAVDCYRGMFQDTRFETAPDLLASTLVTECYRFMFSGCTNLKNIKCLATQNLGNTFTTNWVGSNNKVNIPNSSDCTFVRAGTTAWPSGAHGIPSEWTVEDNGEQSP